MRQRILEQKDSSLVNYLFLNFAKKFFFAIIQFHISDKKPFIKKNQILFPDRNCYRNFNSDQKSLEKESK